MDAFLVFVFIRWYTPTISSSFKAIIKLNILLLIRNKNEVLLGDNYQIPVWIRWVSEWNANETLHLMIIWFHTIILISLLQTYWWEAFNIWINLFYNFYVTGKFSNAWPSQKKYIWTQKLNISNKHGLPKNKLHARKYFKRNIRSTHFWNILCSNFKWKENYQFLGSMFSKTICFEDF